MDPRKPDEVSKAQQENNQIKGPFDEIKNLISQFMLLPEVKNHDKFKNLNLIINEMMPPIFDKIYHLKIILHNKTAEEIKSNKDLAEASELVDKLSGNLATELNKYVQANEFPQVTINDSNGKALTFSDVLYMGALCLANVNPINQMDPFTLDEIASENRVVTSDRHQFDVRGLHGLLKTQPLESLANPLTKVKFSERDKQTILNKVAQYTKDNNLPLQLFAGNAYPNGDPDHAATLALVQELTQNQNNNQNNNVVPVVAPPMQMFGLFQQPQDQHFGNWIVRPHYNHWETPYSQPDQMGMIRVKNYYRPNATHFYNIHLFGLIDGTYAVKISIFGDPQQFIQALQSNGLTPNSPGVFRYPGQTNFLEQALYLHGDLNTIIQVVPNMLDAMSLLEGQQAINPVRDSVLNSFTQFAPTLNHTQ